MNSLEIRVSSSLCAVLVEWQLTYSHGLLQCLGTVSCLGVKGLPSPYSASEANRSTSWSISEPDTSSRKFINNLSLTVRVIYNELLLPDGEIPVLAQTLFGWQPGWDLKSPGEPASLAWSQPSVLTFPMLVWLTGSHFVSASPLSVGVGLRLRTPSLTNSYTSGWKRLAPAYPAASGSPDMVMCPVGWQALRFWPPLELVLEWYENRRHQIIQWQKVTKTAKYST